MYPISLTAALAAVFGSGACMSVYGLAAVFGAQPLVIGLGVGLEAGKLLTVVHLHRAWRRLAWPARCAYAAVAMVLAVLTACEVAGYLLQRHGADTVVLQEQAARIAALASEEAALRHRIAVVDDTLSQLPEGYVTRRISERAAAGYDGLQERLGEVLAAIGTARQVVARARSEAGPVVLLGAWAGLAPERVMGWFILALVCVLEPLGMGLAVATSAAWMRAPKIEEEAPAVMPSGSGIEAAGRVAEAAEPGAPAAQTAEETAGHGRPAEAAAHAAHPEMVEFLGIVSRNGLTAEDVSRITGRRQVATAAGWLEGQPRIPTKALRELRRWEARRPAMRLVKRQAGGG